MNRKNIQAWILAMVLPCVAAPTSQAKSPDMVTYTIRSGDTLSSLSNLLIVRPGSIATLKALNGITDSDRIVAGASLRVPRWMLRYEQSYATIETYSGEVLVRTGKRTIPADVGSQFGKDSVIETGRNSFASLRLTDGSVIAIPSLSSVRIVQLRRGLMTGGVEREFSIEKGRIRAKVSPLTNPESYFHIKTPVSVSAVRGTEFFSGYDTETAKAATAVSEGKVAVLRPRSKSEVLVPSGFGTVATGAGVSTAVPLLAAPDLIDPGRIQNEEALNFMVKPVADAAAYHLSIARDAGIFDTLLEARTEQLETSMPSLPPGSYFVCVSAVDSSGLVGMPRIYTFERRRNSVFGGHVIGWFRIQSPLSVQVGQRCGWIAPVPVPASKNLGQEHSDRR